MDKTIKWIVTIPAIIAGIVLIGIMLLTTADVALRFFFNAPITGSSEITQRFIIVAGFLGLGWCALGNQHIKVDLLIGRLSAKAQKVFTVFNYLVVGAVSVLISVNCYKQARLVKMMNVQSQLLAIPNYPFYLVISFSYMLLALTILFLIVRAFAGKDTPEVKHES